MSETLEEVKKMEADYKDQIGQLRLEIDVVNDKARIQEENLELNVSCVPTRLTGGDG